MTLRALNIEQDIPAIHRIIAESQIADAIDPCSTLEGIPSVDALQNVLAQSAPENAIVAELDGQLVGYNQIIWWTETGNVWLYLHQGRVLPALRGQGIGTALLNWSEARIRTLATTQDAGSTAIYGANASSTETEATRLLLDNGYQAVFSLAQMAYRSFGSLSPLPIPDNVSITRPESSQAKQMWEAEQAAWREIPAFGVATPSESEIEDIRNDIADTGHMWKIAWIDGHIAAQVWSSLNSCGDRQVGVLDEVHTVPEFQHQGLAQLLINQTLIMFREMGVAEVRLHTDDGNQRGAKSLYQKIGFETLKTFPRYRKAIS